jgi:hypothetical protein
MSGKSAPRNEWHRGRRHLKPNRIVREAVLGLDALVTGLRLMDWVDWSEVVPEDSWVEQLRTAETVVRELRVRLEQIEAGTVRRCGRCGKSIAGRSDRKYCSDKCRIDAHRHKVEPHQIEERDRNHDRNG